MRTIGIQFVAQGQTELFDLGSPPELKPTEILLATRYSGVTNGTERHALMAEHVWGHYPSSHGYQMVSQVEAVGGAVEQFQPGEWVFFGRYVGHRGWNVVDVAHTDVHAIGSHQVCPLPESEEYSRYALLGMAGVGMRHVRRCRVGGGDNVWVAGQGLVGQFAAQSARALGAQVTVTDVNEKRLRISRELGAHRGLDAAEPATADALKAGGPYTHIIDACGVAGLYDEIADLGCLGYDGTIGSVSVRAHTTFSWSMLHGREGRIQVSCHFALDDLRVVLHFLDQGIMRVEPLILTRASIDDAVEVYAALRDRPGDLLGIVFDWA